MRDLRAKVGLPEVPCTARSLPIALMRARENVMGPIRAMLADTGVTEQQWRVLRVLAEESPLDASQVAARSCLLLPSLTRIARSMVDRGLITVTPDTGDRRRHLLRISDAGARVIAQNAEAAAAIVEGFKQRLGSEDYELLLDLLAVLSDDPGRP
ncbi:MarR family transcriptional regulator [Primorskyibacter sp. 2E107]|uniref:MarR family transcriptional regulator n=1 Tax=Primorskyibacter sp. 2E107 TaxID=3403458 RepID=UPI003AF9BAED